MLEKDGCLTMHCVNKKVQNTRFVALKSLLSCIHLNVEKVSIEMCYRD